MLFLFGCTFAVSVGFIIVIADDMLMICWRQVPWQDECTYVDKYRPSIEYIN